MTATAHRPCVAPHFPVPLSIPNATLRRFCRRCASRTVRMACTGRGRHWTSCQTTGHLARSLALVHAYLSIYLLIYRFSNLAFVVRSRSVLLSYTLLLRSGLGERNALFTRFDSTHVVNTLCTASRGVMSNATKHTCREGQPSVVLVPAPASR